MTPQFRWLREHGGLHVPDVDTQRNEFPTLGCHRAAPILTVLPFVSTEEIQLERF